MAAQLNDGDIDVLDEIISDMIEESDNSKRWALKETNIFDTNGRRPYTKKGKIRLLYETINNSPESNVASANTISGAILKLGGVPSDKLKNDIECLNKKN